MSGQRLARINGMFAASREVRLFHIHERLQVRQVYKREERLLERILDAFGFFQQHVEHVLDLRWHGQRVVDAAAYLHQMFPQAAFVVGVRQQVFGEQAVQVQQS